jgi:ElaB/YqjD/DUF883 family membrane-anchored ribosome-binding protein
MTMASKGRGNGYQSELSSLRDELGALVDHVGRLVAEKGEESMGDMSRHMRHFRRAVDTAASQGEAFGRAALADARGNLREIGDKLEDSVRERPIAMLALAVGLGIVLGTAWRR